MSKKISFEENKGQVMGKDAASVKYFANLKGFSLFFRNCGLSYQFNKYTYPEGFSSIMNAPVQSKEQREAIEKVKTKIRKETWRIDLDLVNPLNTTPEIISEEKSEDFINYFNHNALDVHSFKRLTYKNVYQGIDWVIYTYNDSMLKYQFIVHAGANPKEILFHIGGNCKSEILNNGGLKLSTGLGCVYEKSPLSFQNGKIIKTNFTLKGDYFGFNLANYNTTQDLIIDPTLSYATYYGGTGYDYTYGLTTDASYNVYFSGYTWSSSSIASGGYDNSFDNSTHCCNYDGFLVKFNSSGSRVWATYYGNSSDDYGITCCVDGSSNVYLVGYTWSTSGIHSAGAHQTSHNGGTEGFLAKFNSSCALQWCTYYGGTSNDYISSVCTDGSNNVYIAGYTSSTSSIASGGHQTAHGGGTNDAFLVKFNSSGTRQWATYYGGSGYEYVNYKSCFCDASNNVYLSGYTSSTSSIASGGHQTAHGGGTDDAFLVKFNSSGTRQWATYYGGSGGDYEAGCVTDASGNVYLAGYTNSSSAIASGGAQNTISTGYDFFLVKFNSSGTRQWGTYWGGNGHDYCYGIAITGSYIAISGLTTSTTGVAYNAYQSANGGNNDYLLAVFTSAGAIQWATYYGGTAQEYGYICAFDAHGYVYIIGNTSAPNLATAGAFQTSNPADASDVLLVRFYDIVLPISLLKFDANCKSNSVYLNWTSSSEINADYYSLEKSEDGYTWEQVGHVKAVGNSQEESNYEYEHVYETIAPTFYKLSETDRDGKMYELQTLFVEDCLNEEITIHPNPCRRNAILYLPAHHVFHSYTIYDSESKRMKTGDITNNRIYTENIPVGFYILEINAGNKYYHLKLLITEDF